MYDLAVFWIPVFAGTIFITAAFSALYAGKEIHATWYGFFGVVGFLLLATVQIDHYLRNKEVMNIAHGATEKNTVLVDAATSNVRRAWISVGPPRLTGKVKVGSVLAIDLTLSNLGEEPALGLNHHGVVTAFDMPAQIDYAPDFWDFDHIIKLTCELAMPIEGKATLFKGQSVHIPIQWNSIDASKEIVKGSKILVLYGCVGYITSNEKRFTTYCFFMRANPQAQGQWIFSSAPIGNGAT